jgi:hypothetical protein
MALSDNWDTAELDRAVAADKKGLLHRVTGVPSPRDLAESALMHSGHSNALRNRDLRVLPGGVVIASPRPKESRNPPPSPRTTPAGQPRPAPRGTGSAGGVLQIVASAPAALGNGVTNAATGGSGDTALGRLMGALIAGTLVLELGSLFAKKYFSLSLGGGTTTVTPAAATTTGSTPSATVTPVNPGATASAVTGTVPTGQLTPAQLAQILGYNP